MMYVHERGGGGGVVTYYFHVTLLVEQQLRRLTYGQTQSAKTCKLWETQRLTIQVRYLKQEQHASLYG